MSSTPVLNTEKTKNHKKKLIQNSIISHISYKIWFWNKFFPLILYRISNRFDFTDYFSYETAKNSKFNFKPFLNQMISMRNMVNEGRIKTIIKCIEDGKIGIDELIDPYSGQRLIHYSILLDEKELFDYLIKHKANLMVKDYLGYTPLFKAASLGREYYFTELIQSGVPLLHYDRSMNSPIDKARLFQHRSILDYVDDKLKGNLKVNQEWEEYWMNKELIEVYKTGSILHKVL